MATIDVTTSVETPSRRALLTGAAAVLSAGAVVQPVRGANAAASPEITAAIAAYWTGVAEANARGASDELVDAKCGEIEAAAARIAAAPCSGIADLAAKAVFFVEVMNYQNAWSCLTDAEGDVMASIEAAALALAGGAA